MPCQGAGDCHSGLICVKPTGLGVGASGVCEPTRRGLGDPCARSSECSVGLACSNETSDGYYGTCQTAIILDGLSLIHIFGSSDAPLMVMAGESGR